MPIGGIGTGSIWLDGQGRLAVWQIFNNLSEPRIPDSFFAVRARSAGRTVVRVLQTVAEEALTPVASLEYEGGYPIARLAFADPAPAGRGATGSLQPDDPVGYGQLVDPLRHFPPHGTQSGPDGGRGGPVGLAAKRRRQPGGRRHPRSSLRRLRRQSQPGAPRRGPRGRGHGAIARSRAAGPIKVRQAGGQEVGGPEMVWLAGAAGLDRRDGRHSGPRRPKRRRRADRRRHAGFPAVDRRAARPSTWTWRPWARSSRTSRRRTTPAGRSPARPLAKAPPTARARPAARQRLCRTRPGQYVPRRRRPAGDGNLEDVPHHSPLYRFPDRRRRATRRKRASISWSTARRSAPRPARIARPWSRPTGTWPTSKARRR